jgi:hypothetical protein
MSLILPVVPAAVKQAFRTGLAEVIEAGWVPTGLPLGRPAGRPMEVWVLDPRHLLVEKPDVNKTAKLVQWQFLVGHLSPRRRSRTFAIDMSCPRGSRTPRMTGLERGPHVADVFEELKDLQRWPSLKSDRYTFRRLRIPALASTFWLKASGNGDDYAVPYHCITRKLKPMHLYRMEHFLAILKPLAEECLKKRSSSG